MRRALLVVGVVAVAAVAGAVRPAAQGARPAAGQEPSPLVFRAAANYVEVDAVVTDGRGAFVRDLQPSDFEVLEDGKRQEVSVFSLVDIPFARTSAGSLTIDRVTAPPDAFSNEREADGRVYLLVLDTDHVDASRSLKVRELARRFIEQNVGANDLAAVAYLGRSDGQDFTADKGLLEAAVDRFIGRKLPSATLLANNLNALGPHSPSLARNAERAAMARDAMSGLASLAQYLAGLRGRRKAVVLFSEGIDLDIDETIGGNPTNDGTDLGDAVTPLLASQVRDAEQAMVGEATRANVSIYSVDPRGVASGADETLLVGGVPQPDTGMAAAPTSQMTAEVRRAQNSLRSFAEQTGGLAAVGSSTYTDAFARIVQDNSSYYVLGYYRAEVKQDGKFRPIAVRLKRPGLSVRARAGYYDERLGAKPPALTAVPAGTSPQVQELLSSPTQIREGLALQAAAEVFRGEEGKALVHLIVELPGQKLPFAARGGTFDNDVEIVAQATDSAGNLQAGVRKMVTLQVNAPTHQAIVDHGLRLATELAVPPGRYRIRVAGRENTGGGVGSVFFDLEAPDFSRAPLAMSDPLVTSSTAGSWPTTGDAVKLQDALPGPATALRSFAAGEALAVFVQVYENDAAHPHQVDLSASVQSAGGTKVFGVAEGRDSGEVGAAGGSYGYRVQVPLATLAPGRYLLTLEARSRLGGEPAVRRVPFSIAR